MDRNITVLLGAGASKPAGLPLAIEMTEQLLTREDLLADPEGLPAFQRMLRFVKDQLEQDDARRGRDERVDVERLFNAVFEIARRDDYEAGAFIDRWLPLIEEIERELTGGRASPSPFAAVARQAPLAVSRLLELQEGVDLSYYDPLFDLFERQGRLTVATLNYDRSLEVAAERQGIPLSTGLENWTKYRRVHFPEDGIRLLKLHGTAELFRMRFHFDWTYDVPDPQLMQGPYYDVETPLITFGGRNKLRVDGPFLDLLYEFKQELRCSHAAVVVGYSFRDSHINTLLDEAMWYAPLKLVSLNRTTASYPRVGHDNNGPSIILGDVQTELAEAIGCAEVPINDCLRAQDGRCYRRRADRDQYPKWCDPTTSPFG